MRAVEIDCPRCKTPRGEHCGGHWSKASLCKERIKAVVKITRDANLKRKAEQV